MVLWGGFMELNDLHFLLVFLLVLVERHFEWWKLEKLKEASESKEL